MDLGNKGTCLFRPHSSKLAVYTVPTKSSASNIFLINGFVKILEVDNFFFLEYTGELRIIILKKIKRGYNTHANPYLVLRYPDVPVLKKEENDQGQLSYPAGSRAERKEIPRAPANDHKTASSLARSRALIKLGAAPSKTHELRCFHKVQAPRITSELNPLWARSWTFRLSLFHQPTRLLSWAKGARLWRLNCCSRLNQNCRANTQFVSRWSIVSSSWSQCGQVAGCGKHRSW